MYDYIVARIGFTVNGTEYNVGDRVTGADADVVHDDAGLQQRCVRVPREHFDKVFKTGPYAAATPTAAPAAPAAPAEKPAAPPAAPAATKA